MESVTVDECFDRFPNEWVCLEVLEEDEAGQSRRGRVVAHSPDKQRVLNAEREFRGDREPRTTVFFAGPLVDPRFDGAMVL